MDQSIQSNSELNIKEVVLKYISNWKWFVLGVFLSFLCAYVYLRYSIPQYKADAKILVKDDRKGGLASELSAFSDLSMLANLKSNVDNEIEVITSRTLIERTIKSLGLEFQYLNIGRVKSEELYKNCPIQLVVVSSNENYFKNDHSYRIENKQNTFAIYDVSDVLIGNFNYGQKIPVEGAALKVL